MWKKLHRNLIECPKPEMDLLHRTFNHMDIDSDGKISLSDLHAVCAKLNYTPAKGELETMIWEVDETLDSTVGWDEFSLSYRRVRSDTTGLEPRALYSIIDFLMHDGNMDGAVSVDEARQLMYMRHGNSMDEALVDALFQQAAGSHVSLVEFLRYSASERDHICKTAGGGNLLTKMRAAQKEKIRVHKSSSSLGAVR
mmetsp:Transcript_36941/g.54205  ORF Transcript_36941/g.54205 Transcript_36941/m.54205 type:complete len:197 (+) Transcript_36941:81-671(+)